MKKINLALIIGSIYILSSCNSAKVITEYDQTVDFSKYKNFLVMERLESDKLDDNTKKFIGSLIAEQLNKRGLNQSLSPDLMVKVMILSQQKETATVTRNNDFYWGSTYYNYGWGIGTNINRVDYNSFTEGTMIIDVIERENNQLVWQGIATSAFKGNKDRKQNDVKLLINKVFGSFPIKPQK